MSYNNPSRLISLQILSLTLVAISFGVSHAQTSKEDSVKIELGKMLSKIFDSKISMDIDTTFFVPQSKSIYMSEEHQSLIMVMVVPQTFDKAEEHFNKESKKDGFKLTDKGKLQREGKSILYQKGTMKKEGKKVSFHMYAVEGNKESTIFLTGVFMPNDEKLIAPQIEKAAVTARLMGN